MLTHSMRIQLTGFTDILMGNLFSSKIFLSRETPLEDTSEGSQCLQSDVVLYLYVTPCNR